MKARKTDKIIIIMSFWTLSHVFILIVCVCAEKYTITLHYIIEVQEYRSIVRNMGMIPPYVKTTYYPCISQKFNSPST